MHMTPIVPHCRPRVQGSFSRCSDHRVLVPMLFVQGWLLITDLKFSVRNTGYGRTAMLKLCLFSILFGFGVLERCRAPRFARSRPTQSRGG